MRRIFSCLLVASGILLLCLCLLAGGWILAINRSDGQIDSAGERRVYLLHVPESLDLSKPVPLVISLHGFADWPRRYSRMTGWNELADEQGFIVAYPRGSGLPLRWRSFGRWGGAADASPDVQFISDLIDQLTDQYNIDPQRVYVNGMSNGGGMTFVLACRLSDKISAWGGVAGAYAMPWGECNPARPLPAIIFHGDADPIVPYQGGVSGPSGTVFPALPEWAQELAWRNGCAAEPAGLPAGGKVSGVAYSGCQDGADVSFYTIHGGGHTWPGGAPIFDPLTGSTSQDIDATRVMWEFFQRQAGRRVP